MCWKRFYGGIFIVSFMIFEEVFVLFGGCF